MPPNVFITTGGSSKQTNKEEIVEQASEDTKATTSTESMESTRATEGKLSTMTTAKTVVPVAGNELIEKKPGVPVVLAVQEKELPDGVPRPQFQPVTEIGIDIGGGGAGLGPENQKMNDDPGVTHILVEPPKDVQGLSPFPEPEKVIVNVTDPINFYQTYMGDVFNQDRRAPRFEPTEESSIVTNETSTATVSNFQAPNQNRFCLYILHCSACSFTSRVR